MRCCAECFGDTQLAKKFDFYGCEPKETCPTCNSSNQFLMNAHEFVDDFELVKGIYVPDENGKILAQLLIEDWSLFPDSKISEAKAQLLIGEIFDDAEIVRQKFSPSKKCITDSVERWKALANELKNENRFFPKSDINQISLQKHLSNLILPVEEFPIASYRARIAKNGTAFEIDKMGAPPANLATSGRANPVGIPYLYLASEEITAISEVRPQPGELICIARFVFKRSPKIIDLRSPRDTISPFLEAEDDDIALLRGDIDYLEMLAHELEETVVPDAAAIDYIPSQYLCEFIKNCGFDGVAYCSSMCEGMNIALFRPELAEAVDLKEVTVKSVKIDLVI